MSARRIKLLPNARRPRIFKTMIFDRGRREIVATTLP
jgi:hypothetical protein